MASLLLSCLLATEVISAQQVGEEVLGVSTSRFIERIKLMHKRGWTEPLGLALDTHVTSTAESPPLTPVFLLNADVPRLKFKKRR